MMYAKVIEAQLGVTDLDDEAKKREVDMYMNHLITELLQGDEGNQQQLDVGSDREAAYKWPAELEVGAYHPRVLN